MAQEYLPMTVRRYRDTGAVRHFLLHRLAELG